jgi:hypothetical protein
MPLTINNFNITPQQFAEAAISFSCLKGRQFKVGDRKVHLNDVIKAVKEEALRRVCNLDYKENSVKELRDWRQVLHQITEKGYQKDAELSKRNLFVQLITKIKHHFSKAFRTKLFKELDQSLQHLPNDHSPPPQDAGKKPTEQKPSQNLAPTRQEPELTSFTSRADKHINPLHQDMEKLEAPVPRLVTPPLGQTPPKGETPPPPQRVVVPPSDINLANVQAEQAALPPKLMSEMNTVRKEFIKWSVNLCSEIGEGDYEQEASKVKMLSQGLPKIEMKLYYEAAFYYGEIPGQKKLVPLSFRDGVILRKHKKKEMDGSWWPVKDHKTHSFFSAKITEFEDLNAPPKVWLSTDKYLVNLLSDVRNNGKDHRSYLILEACFPSAYHVKKNLSFEDYLKLRNLIPDYPENPVDDEDDIKPTWTT